MVAEAAQDCAPGVARQRYADYGNATKTSDNDGHRALALYFCVKAGRVIHGNQCAGSDAAGPGEGSGDQGSGAIEADAQLDGIAAKFGEGLLADDDVRPLLLVRSATCGIVRASIRPLLLFLSYLLLIIPFPVGYFPSQHCEAPDRDRAMMPTVVTHSSRVTVR
jgi:hypothetical protein